MAVKGITTVRNLVSGGVALIAAWSSYSHMVHLVLRYGERPEVAYALPFSVDGMLLVSTIVMADDKRRGHGVRPLARLSFIIGVAASVAANIAAAHPNLGARIIDAWPALALLLVVEMLARPPAGTPAGAEQLTTPRPEPRDVPAAPIPSARGKVPAAKEVPAGLEIPLSPEHPAAAPVPSNTPQFHESAPPTPLPTPPSSAAARSRHERHLQAVPRAHEIRSAEGPPVPSALSADPTPFVASAPAIAVPPEHAVADPTTGVPAEPRDADPLPAQPEHPVPAVAQGAGTQTRPEPHTAQRRSAERKTKARRPATATRALAQRMMQAEPHLTKTEIAQRLDISTRRLRDVLAS
jgi:hypothetical protein